MRPIPLITPTTPIINPGNILFPPEVVTTTGALEIAAAIPVA
jgi:hypothetical protein